MQKKLELFASGDKGALDKPMNISDIITRSEFGSLLERVEAREPFCFEKNFKVADGTVEVEIKTRFIDDELAEKHWHRESYICTLSVSCERTNNQSCWRSPIERRAFLGFSYEELAARIEKNGHNSCFPDNYTYFENFVEQISIFE